jgi:hypothetical protein
MYKTSEQVLSDLKEECVGKIYDDDIYDTIIAAFDSENEIIVNESSNNGYNLIAYENKENSICFCFEINKKGVITDVWY